ncbi:MAG: hypothetical protein LBV33_04220 [Lachnospiraceae bacterium]|jgi:glycogen operon protein|nr:hypothetical protein [Lachnospiraceae bacterium]
MNQAIKTAYFKPERKGVYTVSDGICFCTDAVAGDNCGVIIYDEHDNTLRIPFSPKGRRGCLYGLKVYFPITMVAGEQSVEGPPAGEPVIYPDEGSLAGCRYNYYCDDETVVDPDARVIYGRSCWGEPSEPVISGGFYCQDFDWGDDQPPETPYSDSIIYGMQVRSFTMHKSSGVKHRGTFEGIIGKLPYLQSLGITAIELLPAYEFDEWETIIVPNQLEERSLINGWGFKEAYYYAPKASFGADIRPDRSFKTLVQESHRAGIEVLMYFFFPPTVNRADIPDILRFWVMEYHIDGIHLLGHDLPLSIITHDPLLSGIKILYNEYSYWEEQPRFPNTGVFRDHFKNEIRRLLKGDEDMIEALLYHQRNNPGERGTINYLADYGGFSLFDLTAYDQKHNEANGERNLDGTNHNFSWNCGVEGPSRKKLVRELRLKQIKNALALLFLSQGTPFLYSGDEFGNTRFGNNNTYCQDNEVGWVKWTPNQMGSEVLAFTRSLIELRKQHPILHLPTEIPVIDYAQGGTPIMSYHGEGAWRPDSGLYSRSVGIMCCGRYVKQQDGTDDDSFYFAINMHWKPHRLALPKLPKGFRWSLVTATDPDRPELEVENKELSIMVKERSISIFKSRKKAEGEG